MVVIMLKYILFVAHVANVLFLVSSTVCGNNEIYSKCINGECIGARKCSELGKPIRCVDIDPEYCKEGCLCKKGYLRDETGKCIAEEQCCDYEQHEHYSNCTNDGCYGARHCFEKGKAVKCYDVCPEDCIKGCLCDKGYLRDKNGNCIPEKKCSSKCTKANEEYEECPPTCPARKCGFDDRLVRCAKPLEVGDPNCPPPGCICASGYFRSPKGDCVKWEECPKCKGPYEVYDLCLPKCPPEDCGVDEKLILCKVPPKYPDPECESGCRCADGYKKNKAGQCIPKDYCSKCKKLHEYYDISPDHCPEPTCDSIQKPYPCPKQTLNTTARKGACRCEPGYYRNKAGECVSKEDCLRCLGPHEYLSCGGACDNVCATLSQQNQTNCPIINKKCNKMCYCEKGYARNRKNICVPFKECEPECGQNEEYSICANGGCSKGLKCSDLGELIICRDPVKCEGGCVCKDGYHRNDKDVCISEKDCRGNCSRNEIFSNCTLGHCRNELCSQKDNPVMCPAIPYPCEKGCVCQKYYLRAPNGTCVPEDQCPPEPKCGVNEYHDPCPPSCSPQLCDKSIKFKCLPSTTVCKPACRCKKGHLRNKEGTCVPEKECEPVCGRNEEYSKCIQGVCRAQHCSQKGKPVPCIDIKPGTCKKGCLCKEKYLRAKNGTCIPEEQCEAPTCCENEVYAQCPDISQPRKCSQLGYPLAMPIQSPDEKCPTKPACVCINGYLRNDSGVCIPKDKCPSCGGDPNAKPGCGMNCGRHCSNYNKGPVPCPKICKVNACDCKTGFVYDDIIKKCVRPEKCTPVCGVNEEYVMCPKYTPPQKNLDLGYPLPLPAPVPEGTCSTKPACVCIDGHVRNDEGVCIHIDKCRED